MLKTSSPYDVLLYAERRRKNKFHLMIAPLFVIGNLIGAIEKDENALQQIEF